MTRCRVAFAVSAALTIAAWAIACGDATVGPPPPDPPRPTTVTVSPATAELSALATTVQLSAEVRDQNGQVMSGATVAWATSDASVATVAASGLVTAAGNGSATVTATSGTATGSAAVTVAQVVAEVAVTPAIDTVVTGDTLRLAASAEDANGHPVAEASFAWASGDTAVARVDDTGLATGLAPGTAAITATSGGVTGAAQLTVVAPVPTSVTVKPDTVTLVALGDTVRLVAEVLDEFGREIPDAEVAWSSSHATVATVDSAGLVTAVGVGETTVTATAGEASGDAVVAVMLPVRSVVVSPAEATIGPGDTLRLAAEAFDANGHRVSGAVFTWASSDGSVATVDASGLVRGVGEGTATITAMAGEASGAAEITVAIADDRAALEAFYEATGGPRWERKENWLTDAPLGDWEGVTTDAHGRVVELNLSYNFLSGRIPPEFEKLSKLTFVTLNGNELSGPVPPELARMPALKHVGLAQNGLTGGIPPELGNLPRLRFLGLSENALTGEIPPELANLPLYYLSLEYNRLTGEIPPELARIDGLQRLDLGWNQLAGSIPPELGTLQQLYKLRLRDNALTGSVPPELGRLQNLAELNLSANALTGNLPAELSRMSRLMVLDVSDNADMSGALPKALTALRLNTFRLGGTGICVPRDNEFRAWLLAIPDPYAPLCAPGSAVAHLTQAVQSIDFPVSLVAGEDALLRVFVTSANAGGAHIPPMRATFFENGSETYVADIPGQTSPIPTEIDEGDLEASANVTIPGSVIVPGLEMVVEVDPGGTLDAAVDVQKRIPETGRLAAGVLAVPTFDLVVVPFLRRSDPDLSIVDIVNALAPDDELFEMTLTLLPVEEMELTVHEPVWTSSAYADQILAELNLLRLAEGNTGYYLGTWGPRVGGGLAWQGQGVAVADLEDWIVAHELGHTFSLAHAPCGNPLGVDPAYPYPDGSTGAWGYDSRSGTLVPPDTPELMAYCGSEWISDYHFRKAMGHRLTRESGASSASASVAAATGTSLLLWGGANPDGAPFLEPAFVVDAPPALPEGGGAYRIFGSDAHGNELFSLNFDMEEIADGDGSTAFAFAVPAHADWAGALARITLSGPDGAVEMDRNGGSAAALLRDPVTGRFRGVLRDWRTEGPAGAAALAHPPEAGLEVQVSRGVPDAEAWRW